jgi:hypothetical protein
VKVFTKTINRCNECPSIGYTHFDGEGESCPYEYHHGHCSAVKKDLPFELIVRATYEECQKEGYVPERRIPDWCSLTDA